MVSNNVQQYANYIVHNFFPIEDGVNSGLPSTVSVNITGPYTNTGNIHIHVQFPCNNIQDLRLWNGYVRHAVTTVQLALSRIGYINFQALLLNERGHLIEPSYNALRSGGFRGSNTSDALVDYVIHQLNTNHYPYLNIYEDPDAIDWNESGNTALLQAAGFNLSQCSILYRIILRITDDNFPLFISRLRRSLNLLNNHIIQAQIRENARLEQLRAEIGDISPSVSSLSISESSSSEDESHNITGLFSGRPVSPSDLVILTDYSSSHDDDKSEYSTDYDNNQQLSGESELELVSDDDDDDDDTRQPYLRMLSSSSSESDPEQQQQQQQQQQRQSDSSSSDEEDIFTTASYYPNRLVSFNDRRPFIDRHRHFETNRYNLRKKVKTNPKVLALLKGYTNVGSGIRKWRISLNRFNMTPLEKLSFHKLRQK